MRSEKEMLDLILGYARGNEDVRAVIMNGSRVNPDAKKDPFQDYDIVYLVKSVEPYRRNPEIPRYFGDILILQTPEDMVDPPPSNDGGYGYLMQFMDGNRIDLGFYPTEHARRCVEDTLSVVLLDKDHLIGELPPPNDLGYLPQKPTAKAFEDCCNEFWWVTPYAAKGLWRDELTYAKQILDVYIRDQLMKMLTWYFGLKTGFQKSPGKEGKYLKGPIGDELWDMLERTYSDARPESTWEALFVMGELFRQVAKVVASEFRFTYPEQDDRNVSAYIRRIKALPRDARTI
jgi:aminoglycoside 6-adenylyltransferase